MIDEYKMKEDLIYSKNYLRLKKMYYKKYKI